MSFTEIKNIVFGMVLGAVVALPLFAYFRPPKTEIKTEVKETIVRDTITLYKPVEIEHRVVDTMWVAVRDTIVRKDTTYVVLPREIKIYADTTYKAVVSGYEPRLESIEVYPTTIYRTTTRFEKPKMSVGLQVGIGYCGEIKPYIGIGISYNLFYLCNSKLN